METYEHLAVNAGELAEALENHLDNGSWMLNLETGEVILVPGRMVDEEPEDDEDFEDAEKFLPILPIPSHEGFRIMEDFVATLPDSEGSRSLERALGHTRPFRGFKDTLLDFPELRERWFKYHDGRMVEKAQEWLEDNLPGASLSVG
jgi:hypothetical protein